MLSLFFSFYLGRASPDQKDQVSFCLRLLRKKHRLNFLDFHLRSLGAGLRVGFIALMLHSCVSVGVYPLRKGLVHHSSDCELTLFWSEADISFEKEDLCAITLAHPRYPWKNSVLDESIDYIYPQACRCGGDGMYIERKYSSALKVVAFRYKQKSKPVESSINLDLLKSRLVCFEQNGVWKEQRCDYEDDWNPENMPDINYRKRI